MCKQALLTNMKKIETEKLNLVIDTILGQCTKTERSGLGYFFATESGIFGEKSLKTDSFRSLTAHESSPWSVKTHEYLGQYGQPAGPAFFHGRTSTNEISLVNTHPLSKDNIHLVHNGVVNNIGPSYKRATTNDTEHLVHYFKKDNCTTKSLEKYITGYYAFLSYNSDTKETHIIRDNIAPLYSTWIDSIESYFFATTENIIVESCKALSWNYGPIESMDSDLHLVFQGNTLISMSLFKSLGYGQREASFATKSLGRELTSPVKKDVESESYVNFLDSIATMGPKDSLCNNDGFVITQKQFRKLSLKDKKLCYLNRDDGTECTPDYDTKKENNLSAWSYDDNDNFLKRA